MVIEAHLCRCLPGSAYSASQNQRRPAILPGGMSGQPVCALHLPFENEELPHSSAGLRLAVAKNSHLSGDDLYLSFPNFARVSICTYF